MAPNWHAQQKELKEITGKLTVQEVLRVSVGPYLSSQWLLPRIGAFEAQHPGLRVNLIHTIGPPDASLADVSIIWAELDSPASGTELLFDTKAVRLPPLAVQLPDAFWNGHLPPIHYGDRSTWRHWLAAAGAPSDSADRGEVLEEPHIVLEAAAYGREIAIGFLPFIGKFFEQGRLVPASSQTVRSGRGYSMISNARDRPMIGKFAKWFCDEAGTEVVSAENPGRTFD